jgi:hypothetical protein
MPPEPRHREIVLVYDEECPLCGAYCGMVRIRRTTRSNWRFFSAFAARQAARASSMNRSSAALDVVTPCSESSQPEGRFMWLSICRASLSEMGRLDLIWLHMLGEISSSAAKACSMPLAGSPAAIFCAAYSWKRASALCRRVTVILGTVSCLQRETTRLSQRLTRKLRVFTVRIRRTSGDSSPYREILSGNIVKTARQLTTTSTRTTGRDTSARAVATVAVNQVAFMCGLESSPRKPWIHGYRDPRRHPGQQDV